MVVKNMSFLIHDVQKPHFWFLHGLGATTISQGKNTSGGLRLLDLPRHGLGISMYFHGPKLKCGK
jgi:hypothetical protein